MRRGLVVACAGLVIWAMSRLAGSPGLHLVAVGILTLPVLAWYVGARRTGKAFSVIRRVTSHQVAVGDTLEIALTVHNHTHRTSSFLLLEDRLPPALGGPQRLVLDRIPPGNAQTVVTQVVPTQRGRFTLPRLTLEASDPFDLTRARLSSGEPSELLVAPRVEPLAAPPRGAFGAGRGESASRQLYLAGEEFYTIRGYQTGDDLRRIHWPSTARSGQLMIRQDETARRAAAIIFLDTRAVLLGQSGAPAFERAVSAAASVGTLLVRGGFAVRLATPDQPLVAVTEDALLEALATVGPSGAARPGAAQVRAAADAATTLLLVSGLPGEAALPSLLSTGSGFGQRIAILVHPLDRSAASAEDWRREEGRALGIRRALGRAGWEVVVVQPSGRLEEAWRHRSVRSAP